jgi:hypothetical protein
MSVPLEMDEAQMVGGSLTAEARAGRTGGGNANAVARSAGDSENRP